MYPEVFAYPDVAGKVEYLTNLRNSYLYRDILMLERVKNSQKLQEIVTLLALQIGSEVSLNEIATTVGLARNTVERYIDLLEKSFVIKKLPAFSRNLRKEIGKSAKYYFLDTGVRNAVINNFNRLELRNDTGALWENFVVMEMLKAHEARQTGARFWFWRTYEQQEMDLVVESDGAIRGYEIKWNPRKARIPKVWRETYGPGEIITRENLLQILQPLRRSGYPRQDGHRRLTHP
jgi:predicted AAA+ superfamily ATPase